MMEKSLQEIEDSYRNSGYSGRKLQKVLARDKEYQKLLKERRQKLTKKFKFKVTSSEKKKYVLSTDADFEILAKCKKLEKVKMKKEDKFLVKLIRTQLELEWRKYLVKTLDQLLKSYKQK